MRKRFRPIPHATGELNLVPYLDVVVNLVMFFLLSITGFVTFRAVNANVELPSSRDGAGGGARDVYVQVMASEVRIAWGEETRVVHRNKNVLDLEGMVAELASLRPQTGEVAVRLAAEAGVPYADIVATMDAIRGVPERPLFENVVLAPAVAAR
jgi:biopolymer transport protein TolR